MVFLKEFFKKVDFEKSADYIKYEKFCRGARVNSSSGTLDEVDNTTAMGESCRIIGDSNVFAFVKQRLIGYNINNLRQYIL